jgi:hypothetical protein
MMKGASVSREGIFDVQVCVPAGWTDEQVVAFANEAYPCSTRGGWFIRREGDHALCGDPERCQCEEDPNNVHVMLDA